MLNRGLGPSLGGRLARSPPPRAQGAVCGRAHPCPAGSRRSRKRRRGGVAELAVVRPNVPPPRRASLPASPCSVTTFSKDTKLIYRHFATLYFVVAADGNESDLGLLDLVQVFVETLDKKFENVCELDLIFRSDMVHHILDEVVMGGMVLETSGKEIMDAVTAMERLELETRSAAIKA